MQNWLVIRTRPRWEKKVAKRLLEKGVEAFCPLVKVQRQWSDRLKTIEMPLLKSCLFVRIAEEQRAAVRLTEGVINFVYKSGKPVVIKEKQMQLLRQFQANHPQIMAIEDGGETFQSLAFAGNGKTKKATLRIEILNVLLVAGRTYPLPVKDSTDK